MLHCDISMLSFNSNQISLEAGWLNCLSRSLFVALIVCTTQYTVQRLSLSCCRSEASASKRLSPLETCKAACRRAKRDHLSVRWRAFQMALARLNRMTRTNICHSNLREIVCLFVRLSLAQIESEQSSRTNRECTRYDGAVCSCPFGQSGKCSLC